MPSAVSNGTTSVASRAHSAAMNLPTWTWAGWVKRTGTGESDYRLFNKASGTATGLNVTGQSANATRLRGRMATGTSSFDISITNNGTINAGVWECLFVVFNQSDPTRAMRIFRYDGVDSVDEQTYFSGSDSGAAPAFNTADLTFFNSTDGSQCYAGKAAHFVYTADVWDNATMLAFATGTLPAGLMDHYWPMQADLDDAGDVGGLHMTGSSVTFDPADSPPVDYSGGGETGSGGSETTVSALSEGGGVAGAGGASEATVSASAEGSGRAGTAGGAEAIVSALAEGAGVAGAAGGSEATVTASAEGSGIKASSGGVAATVSALAAGLGSKASSGGASPTVTITATGAGGNAVSGGSEASITAEPEGSGTKGGAGGSEAGATVTAEGAGARSASGGSTANVTVTAEGGGTPVDTPSGGSQTTVTVAAQGSGFAARSGFGSTVTTATAQGSGSTARSGGGEAIVSVTATGAGGSVISGPSPGRHTLVALTSAREIRSISKTNSLIALED